MLHLRMRTLFHPINSALTKVSGRFPAIAAPHPENVRIRRCSMADFRRFFAPLSLPVRNERPARSKPNVAPAARRLDLPRTNFFRSSAECGPLFPAQSRPIPRQPFATTICRVTPIVESGEKTEIFGRCLLVLPVGIEPTTPSLPRTCATPTLRQQPSVRQAGAAGSCHTPPWKTSRKGNPPLTPARPSARQPAWRRPHPGPPPPRA